MASGDKFDFVRPQEYSRDGGPIDNVILQASSKLAGVALDKAGNPWFFEGVIPANGTPLATGLTFKGAVAGDPANPAPSTNIRVGISVKPIASGADNSLTSFGTESVATVAMDATNGNETQFSIAVANAALGSLAAGGRYLVRIRRVPNDALDTCKNRVILFGMSISDT